MKNQTVLLLFVLCGVFFFVDIVDAGGVFFKGGVPIVVNADGEKAYPDTPVPKELEGCAREAFVNGIAICPPEDSLFRIHITIPPTKVILTQKSTIKFSQEGGFEVIPQENKWNSGADWGITTGALPVLFVCLCLLGIQKRNERRTELCRSYSIFLFLAIFATIAVVILGSGYLKLIVVFTGLTGGVFAINSFDKLEEEKPLEIFLTICVGVIIGFVVGVFIGENVAEIGVYRASILDYHVLLVIFCAIGFCMKEIAFHFEKMMRA